MHGLHHWMHLIFIEFTFHTEHFFHTHKSVILHPCNTTTTVESLKQPASHRLKRSSWTDPAAVRRKIMKFHTLISSKKGSGRIPCVLTCAFSYSYANW